LLKYKVVWAYHSGDLEREVNEILKQNQEKELIQSLCTLVIGNYEKALPDGRKGKGTCLVQTLWFKDEETEFYTKDSEKGL